MTNLKEKAINIKGKDYVQVKDRILYLADEIKDYSIETKYEYFAERKLWVVKATLKIGENKYTGLAQEIESDNYKEVNHTSALENCETSAVGRACAMAGIGVLDSIASVDEMNKATNRTAPTPPPAQERKWQNWNNGYTPRQKTEGGICPDCGGVYVRGKTGNVFCQNKCWLPENRHLTENRTATTSMPSDNEEVKIEDIPFKD